MKITSDLGVTACRRRSRGDWRSAWRVNDVFPVLSADYRRGVYGLGEVRRTFSDLHAFTRPSEAQRFNALGHLVTTASDVPRITHTAFEGTVKGLWVEPAATNALPHADLGGAAVGPLSGAGALPEGWSLSGFDLSNVSTDVLADHMGMPYLRLRFTGTPTASTAYLFLAETTSITAAPDEAWAVSLYARMASGSLSGFSDLRLQGSGWTAQGGYVSGSPSQFIGDDIAANVTSDFNRFNFSGHLEGASVERLRPALRFGTTGAPLDLAIDIALPQAELGQVATSPILTGSTAQTRAADQIGLKLASGVYDFRITDAEGVITDLHDYSHVFGNWLTGVETGIWASLQAYPPGTL